MLHKAVNIIIPIVIITGKTHSHAHLFPLTHFDVCILGRRFHKNMSALHPFEHKENLELKIRLPRCKVLHKNMKRYNYNMMFSQLYICSLVYFISNSN